MNKADLVSKISAENSVSKAERNISKKEVDIILNAFFDVIKKSLKEGEKITIVGFGTFLVLDKKETLGINPRTKERIKISARKVAKLKFSDTLNASLNE